MTAEEYLEQIKKIDSMIRNKLRDYQRWAEVADGMGGAALGERVQSSRNLHRGSDAIGNYIDIEREINALKKERQTIIQTIERLPPDEYTVIYGLYVDCYSMKEIAYTEKKSYDWMKRKKRKGLALIQSHLDAEVAKW